MFCTETNAAQLNAPSALRSLCSVARLLPPTMEQRPIRRTPLPFSLFLCFSVLLWIVPHNSAAPTMNAVDPAVIQEILRTPGPYANKEEEETCRRMVVNELTEQQQETAARTSYAYFLWTKASDSSCTANAPSSDKPPDDDAEIRIRMAMREARRHLVDSQGDYDTAVLKLKNTIKWREEVRIDAIRTCFCANEENLSEEDAEFAASCRSHILEDLDKQLMAVRGHDKDKRAIIIKKSRTAKSDETTYDSYLKVHVFMAEKAIAATEIKSRGKEEKLVALYDFKDYQSGSAPPVDVLKETATTLQAHYPERLRKAILLDPPLWMQALFTLVHAFLAAETGEKISMLAEGRFWSNDYKDQEIRSFLDPEQAMPFMLKDGHLTSEIDIDRLLNKVPFHSLYDEVVDGNNITAKE